MQKHHLDATQILDQMQVEFLYFLFSLKESMILPWLLCFTFFDLAHLFFRRTFGGGKLFLPVWTNKNTSDSPVFFHSTLFSWSFCFSLRKKSCFRALFKLQVVPLNLSRNKKKLWHFNGVLLEALQFSMLSYSNSCHLLWANNSISNLLTHLESVRCEIWIFPPVL